MDLSAGIAWFGAYEIEGSLVEIGPRSVFLNSAVGVRHSPAGEGPRTT